MKKITLLILLTLTFGCRAEPAAVSPQFKQAIKLLSSEAVFKTSFQQIMAQLKGLCTAGKRKPNGEENVTCTARAGISNIVFYGTAMPALTAIDTSFVGLEKCAYVKQEATKKYGKASEDKGPCDAKWMLKPLKNGPERHLTLSPRNEKNSAILMIDEDDEW
jgi:hypothetical protein